MTKQQGLDFLVAWFRDSLRNDEQELARLESMGFHEAAQYLRESIELKKKAMKRLDDLMSMP